MRRIAFLAPILSMGERGAANWFIAELLRVDGELALQTGARAELSSPSVDSTNLSLARKQAP